MAENENTTGEIRVVILADSGTSKIQQRWVNPIDGRVTWRDVPTIRVNSKTFAKNLGPADGMTEITVNGQSFDAVPGSDLSYADIMTMIGEKPDRVLSVIVKQPGREGSALTPGNSFRVAGGEYINAVDTSRA